MAGASEKSQNYVKFDAQGQTEATLSFVITSVAFKSGIGKSLSVGDTMKLVTSTGEIIAEGKTEDGNPIITPIDNRHVYGMTASVLSGGIIEVQGHQV